jgi:hypothetical protein
MKFSFVAIIPIHLSSATFSQDDKSLLIWHQIFWKALLIGNLERPITFHYSIAQQHPVPIPRIQNVKLHQERLFTGT